MAIRNKQKLKIPIMKMPAFEMLLTVIVIQLIIMRKT